MSFNLKNNPNFSHDLWQKAQHQHYTLYKEPKELSKELYRNAMSKDTTPKPTKRKLPRQSPSDLFPSDACEITYIQAISHALADIVSLSAPVFEQVYLECNKDSASLNNRQTKASMSFIGSPSPQGIRGKVNSVTNYILKAVYSLRFLYCL